MIRKPHPSLIKFLSAYDRRVADLALALRRMDLTVDTQFAHLARNI